MSLNEKNDLEQQQNTIESSSINIKNEIPSSPNINNINLSFDEEEIQSEDISNFDPKDAFIKLSGYSIKELRLIRTNVEEIIFKKIKTFERIDKTRTQDTERSVYYMKDYVIDKVGCSVIVGETGIAEGWTIPIYKNEFHNLLGLPFTEDNALSEILRVKRPRQECFNCLATNHRVQECPIKIDEQRIAIHRDLFNTQSHQAQEQASLFSNRYTNDLDSKTNRGFIPGKISDNLKEALGIKPNQLPPYVYMMRKFGYPIGWLIEAQVKKTKLTVHVGSDADTTTNVYLKEEEILGEEGQLKSIENNENNSNTIKYDPNKIFSFIGFNEPLPLNINDECEKYGVRKYGPDLSKEKFLSTLNLEKAKKIVRRNLSESKNQSQLDLSSNDEQENDKNSDNSNTNSENNKSEENNLANSTNNEISTEEEGETIEDRDYVSPKKRKSRTISKNEIGTSFSEILGTPIVDNVSGVNRVPNWEKFSENICEHKPFEMNSQTSTRSYQNIVNLTRKFKSSTAELN